VTAPALPWIFAGLNLGLTVSCSAIVARSRLNQGLGSSSKSSAATSTRPASLPADRGGVAWVFSAFPRLVGRLLRWKR
jgi:hypothetical protein